MYMLSDDLAIMMFLSILVSLLACGLVVVSYKKTRNFNLAYFERLDAGHSAVHKSTTELAQSLERVESAVNSFASEIVRSFDRILKAIPCNSDESSKEQKYGDFSHVNKVIKDVDGKEEFVQSIADEKEDNQEFSEL